MGFDLDLQVTLEFDFLTSFLVKNLKPSVVTRLAVLLFNCCFVAIDLIRRAVPAVEETAHVKMYLSGLSKKRNFICGSIQMLILKSSSFTKIGNFFLFSLFVMGPSLYYVSKWSEKCQLIQNGNKFLNPKIDWRLFGNCELYSNVSLKGT